MRSKILSYVVVFINLNPISSFNEIQYNPTTANEFVGAVWVQEAPTQGN